MSDQIKEAGETSDILNEDGKSPEGTETQTTNNPEDPSLYYSWPLNHHMTTTVLIITHHTVIS